MEITKHTIIEDGNDMSTYEIRTEYEHVDDYEESHIFHKKEEYLCDIYENMLAVQKLQKQKDIETCNALILSAQAEIEEIDSKIAIIAEL